MKMKKPQFLIRKQKLRAATGRAAASESYDDAPNMKLSSAFIVVLVLHVVAVGGIYAFKSIKERKSAYADAAPVEVAAPAAGLSEPEPAAASAPQGDIYTVRAGDTLTRIAAAHRVTVADLEKANGLQNVAAIQIGQSLMIPDPMAAAVAKPKPAPQAVQRRAPESSAPKAAAAAPASDRIYEVKKGDNPVAIARHLGVDYNELLKLNGIDDPRKLQIGSKLKVPAPKGSK